MRKGQVFFSYRLWAGIGSILVTAAGIAILELLTHTPFRVPNPPAILLLSIVYATFRWGTIAGAISTAMAWLYFAYYFSIPGEVFRYTDDNLRRVIVWAIALPAIVFMVGRLKRELREHIYRTVRVVKERIAIEEQLHTQDIYLRTVVTSTPIILFALDRNGTYTLSEGKGLETIGIQPGERIGQSLYVVYRDNPTVLQNFRRALSGETFNYTMEAKGKVFEIRLSPLHDPDGAIEGVIGVATDITEQRRAEKRLALHSLILETMAEGVCLVRAQDGVIAYTNPKFEQMFGYGAGELIGKPISVVNYDDGSKSAEAIAQAIANLVEQQGEVSFEIQNVKKDGTPFWCGVQSAIFEHPEFGWVYVSVQEDITEQKQAEAALTARMEEEREFQNYLKALHEVTIELMTINDLDAFYKCAVERGLQRLGFDRLGLLLYDPEDAVAIGTYGTNAQGKLVAEHDIRFDPGGLTSILMRALQKEEHFALDEQAQLFDHYQPIGTGWNAVAVLWNGAEKVGWLATDNGVQHRPFTKPLLNVLALYALTLGTLLAQKRAEQQALELEKERARVKILSDFIRDTSHDFRTPLTIIGNSLYLLSKTADAEKQKHYVANAQQNVSRLTQLVDRLLTMTGLDSQIVFAFQRLDVNQVVADFCTQVRLEAKGDASRVCSSLWESSLMVQADPEQLSLALAEIGHNAVRYTPPDGMITISTRRQDNQAVIEVRDTGIGIPEVDLPHIFERLYRVDKARSMESGGAGIGLSIVKRIIELHQGRIDVESAVGVGSVFRVWLPTIY